MTLPNANVAPSVPAMINLSGNNFTGGGIDFACSQPDNHLSVDCVPGFVECGCCDCDD